MEIQIPLILFTSLLAWAAGAFATQAVCALAGKGGKIQHANLVVSLVILAVGGVAVLFHLAQPFHIFNGFGNPTSGITQELVAIVIVVVVMVVYFIAMGRSDSGASVPKPVAIAAIAVSLLLDVIMSHSYMMAARPVWDSLLQISSIVGGSLVMGPATVALLAGVVKPQGKLLALLTKVPFVGEIDKLEDDDVLEFLKPVNLIGVGCNAVIVIIYFLYMAFVSGDFVGVGYYFDPTSPTMELFNSGMINPFSADALPYTVVTLVGVVISVAGTFLSKDKDNWKTAAVIIIVGGLICTIALRVTFYVLGISVYPLYTSTLA